MANNDSQRRELLRDIAENQAGSDKERAASLALSLIQADQNTAAAKRLVWATWGVVIATVIQIGWQVAGHLFEGQGEVVTVYQAVCDGAISKDQTACLGQTTGTDWRWQYRADFASQTVYSKPLGFGFPVQLTHCTVWDAENWICQDTYLGPSTRIMSNGRYAGYTPKGGSTTGDTFYISSWRWWFIRLTKGSKPITPEG